MQTYNQDNAATAEVVNLQAEKIQLTKWILGTDNVKVLDKIRNILIKEQNVDFWNKLSLEQKKDIELGLSEVADGKVIEYETLMDKFRV
jgi:hypothetical protein